MKQNDKHMKRDERLPMTDYDARLSYAAVHYPFGFPTILADGYWEHYMDLTGQTDRWNRFLDLYKSEGFGSNVKFMEMFNCTAEKAAGLMFNGNADECMAEIHRYAAEVKSWDVPDFIRGIRPGRYLKIDIHSGIDAVLRETKTISPGYRSIMEIVDKISEYKMFKDMKSMKFRILRFNGISMNPDVIKILRNVMLKRVYESGIPEIETLNRSCRNIYASTNDMYIYDLDDISKYEHLCGDYSAGDVDFNISVFRCASAEILGNAYHFAIDPTVKLVDCNLRAYPRQFVPLMIRIARDETPDKMDLAVGYEDQIFFHLNENDYKIL